MSANTTHTYRTTISAYEVAREIDGDRGIQAPGEASVGTDIVKEDARINVVDDKMEAMKKMKEMKKMKMKEKSGTRICDNGFNYYTMRQPKSSLH